MLRSLSFTNLSKMVKERKRKICTTALDNMVFGRIPDKVKRYKKLSLKSEERTVSCCQSSRLLCKTLSPEKGVSCSLGSDQVDKKEQSIEKELTELKPASCLTNMILALDCEMVECMSTTGSSFDSLARCSIVGYDGAILLDLYIEQMRPVLNYRYRFSGISERILKQKPCVSYKEARERVKKTIDGKLLVGHSIHNDFQALRLSHPHFLTIDLASKSLLSMLSTLPNASPKFGLKSLAYNHLNKVIQERTHCSVEDSRATMEVFKCVENLWLRKNESIASSLSAYHGSYLGDEYWPSDVENE